MCRSWSRRNQPLALSTANSDGSKIESAKFHWRTSVTIILLQNCFSLGSNTRKAILAHGSRLTSYAHLHFALSFPYIKCKYQRKMIIIWRCSTTMLFKMHAAFAESECRWIGFSWTRRAQSEEILRPRVDDQSITKQIDCQSTKYNLE